MVSTRSCRPVRTQQGGRAARKVKEKSTLYIVFYVTPGESLIIADNLQLAKQKAELVRRSCS